MISSGPKKKKWCQLNFLEVRSSEVTDQPPAAAAMMMQGETWRICNPTGFIPVVKEVEWGGTAPS